MSQGQLYTIKWFQVLLSNINNSIKLNPLFIYSEIVSKECWEQYWTSPGSNTPQGTNNTLTYHYHENYRS